MPPVVNLCQDNSFYDTNVGWCRECQEACKGSNIWSTECLQHCSFGLVDVSSNKTTAGVYNTSIQSTSKPRATSLPADFNTTVCVGQAIPVHLVVLGTVTCAIVIVTVAVCAVVLATLKKLRANQRRSKTGASQLTKVVSSSRMTPDCSASILTSAEKPRGETEAHSGYISLAPLHVVRDNNCSDNDNELSVELREHGQIHVSLIPDDMIPSTTNSPVADFDSLKRWLNTQPWVEESYGTARGLHVTITTTRAIAKKLINQHAPTFPKTNIELEEGRARYFERTGDDEDSDLSGSDRRRRNAENNESSKRSRHTLAGQKRGAAAVGSRGVLSTHGYHTTVLPGLDPHQQPSSFTPATQSATFSQQRGKLLLMPGMTLMILSLDRSGDHESMGLPKKRRTAPRVCAGEVTYVAAVQDTSPHDEIPHHCHDAQLVPILPNNSSVSATYEVPDDWRSTRNFIFSGTLTAAPLCNVEIGLTVGHPCKYVNRIFMSNVDCQHRAGVSHNCRVGACFSLTRVKMTTRNPDAYMEADLSLIKFARGCCPRANTIVREGVRYSIKLYKGSWDSLPMSGIPVMIFNRDGVERRGHILSATYDLPRFAIQNALLIQSDDGQVMTEKGDSGALVLSIPDVGSNAPLLVYGIAFGTLDPNRALANRLWDVLRSEECMEEYEDIAGPNARDYVNYIDFVDTTSTATAPGATASADSGISTAATASASP